MADTKEHGNLSINSQNIFPIIKKWMYSDHDIFIRELVSNACDAITKLKKLSLIGEYEEPDDVDYKVEVRISSKNKTIKIIDNGLGMTKDEVDEYINQIAFSGASDFLEKYKDKADSEQIIGHFGLAFIQLLWCLILLRLILSHLRVRMQYIGHVMAVQSMI